MTVKSKPARYGLLLACYMALVIVVRVMLPTIDHLGNHFGRFLAGGWVFWFIGPIWWRMPIYKANPWALLIYHSLYFVGFAYATRRIKNLWIVLLLLLAITWFTGYLLCLWQGGTSFLSQYISGHYAGF